MADSGICSVCGRTFTLRRDGKLRHHGDGYTFPPKRCAGAGTPPSRGMADAPPLPASGNEPFGEG